MLNGFYTAAAGMLMQQRSLNVLSNNMANIKTPGFKAERVVSTTFEGELMIRKEAGEKNVIGRGSTMRVIDEVATNFDPSYIEETGRPLDMAINGEGFFCIQGENQQFLTRNGSFDIDEGGYLVLKGAGKVLGERGAIRLDSSDFTISSEGQVYDSEGRLVDRILVSQVPAQELQKYANGLYIALTPQRINNGYKGFSIVSKAIERSNIDLNREMSMVMESQRAFQSCGALLKSIDQLNQKTANLIAGL